MEISFEEIILQRIGEKNPMHLKKIRKNLRRIKADPEFNNLAEKFYEKFDAYLAKSGKTREYAIDCYLRMIADFLTETLDFEKTGKYSSSSFEEVNARVYSNPGVMEYYMHGLLLTQFIWAHHYELLKFFAHQLDSIPAGEKQYLEIGGGHGLYATLAQEHLKGNWNYSVVDISPTSLELSKNFAGSDNVKFVLADVFTLMNDSLADLIVMGEVLEHVEDPGALLRKLRELLKEDGRLFITTPTNAPAIDHIYLFRNREEIRELIIDSGFEIVNECCFSSEDISVEEAEARNIPLSYGAFLRKK